MQFPLPSETELKGSRPSRFFGFVFFFPLRLFYTAREGPLPAPLGFLVTWRLEASRRALVFHPSPHKDTGEGSLEWSVWVDDPTRDLHRGRGTLAEVWGEEGAEDYGRSGESHTPFHQKLKGRRRRPYQNTHKVSGSAYGNLISVRIFHCLQVVNGCEEGGDFL